MCFEVQDKDANAEVKPFYMANWLDVTDYDNVYGSVTIRFKDYEAGQDGITAFLNWRGQYSEDIPTMAKIVKEEFDKLPEGARYIKLLRAINKIIEPECMVYLDKGAKLYADWLEVFCKEYQRIGGKLDVVAVDLEYNGVNASHIRKAYHGVAKTTNEDGQTEEWRAGKEIYNKIVNHPSYATKVRPFLEERGFQFSEPDGEKSEIFGIYDLGSQNAEIWNAVMRNHLCTYVNASCAPIMKYFPEVTLGNYRFPSSKGWQESVGQKGERSYGGNTMYAGNTANENFYVRRPLKQYFDTTVNFNKPVFYNGAVYADNPFNSFLYEMNTFKDMYEASDTKRLSAWVTGFNYKHLNAPAGSTRLTPYYSEAIFHLGLLNISTFNGYIVGPRDTDLPGEPYNYDDNIKVFSELLDDLTRVAGYADRKTLSVPTEWNSAFVLSGMYAGGRNIWRLTPNTLEGTSLEAFKVKDDEPTFRINGQTITFPKGKIIADGKVSYIGTCGYWIETPADVTPVIINDADRYEKYPAYEENFESYAADITFSSTTARHENAWETTGSLLVETQGSGKALAMTGNTSVKNVKLPKNVTAGDSFAKQQVWEVKVTLPSSGTVTVLTCADNDGGITIADGKVYYDEAGSYQELSGMTLSAGSTYTIRREVDFRTADNFKSSYAVYDVDGKRLGGADNVAMVSVALPVKAIEFSSAIVSGTAYLDDYKLYATGVAVDLTLYDEKFGLRVTEPDKARADNTAYRLSWLNGTASEKAYSVVAAYYNGDKLVEEKVVREVKMAPGSDHVEIGIVEAKDGQAVRIYVRNNS